MLKYKIIFLLLGILTKSAYAFTFNDVKEPIMGIPATTLNNYVNDSFFKSYFSEVSQIHYIYYQATEDEKFIYLPSQAYFPNDPNCCPTTLHLKIDKSNYELMSVEILRD